MDWKRISEGHERLKRRIHNARMPLPRWAIPIAKLVYFSIPVAFGVWLMMWTFEQMDKNVGTLVSVGQLRGSLPWQALRPSEPNGDEMLAFASARRRRPRPLPSWRVLQRRRPPRLLTGSALTL